MEVYKNPIKQSEKMEKDIQTVRSDKIKAKIEQIVDQYNTESTSKIKIIKFDDGKFVENYDTGSVDFSKPEVYKDKENQPIASFLITGGLNGRGEWTKYLEDLKKVFEDLGKEFKGHVEIEKLENDIADDVWTTEVFLYEDKGE